MAKRINFWELPVEDAQPDDTLPAYRGRGEVARVRVPTPGGGGTVTSVGVSMPTGFAVANSPVTSSGTITVTFASGYGLPTTAKQGQWDTAYSWGNHALAGYALASTVTSALAGKVDKVAGKGLSTEDYSTAEKSKLADIQAGATANQTDAYLLNRANHTGTQAASTITGLATVATSGSYNDLTDKPTISGGTVTSVSVSVPTGLQASGGPVTSSGTITISYASGYAIPTTAKQGQWDTAYGWGNHASAGYVTTAAMQAYTYSKSEVDSLLSGVSSGSRVWQSATTTLTKNTAHKIDFSSPRTLTLPASPSENDYVEILRLAGSTANSTIARNGQTIMGLAENLTLDVDIQYIRLDFVNSSWRIAS